jgi:hypothetical protein
VVCSGFDAAVLDPLEPMTRSDAQRAMAAMPIEAATGLHGGLTMSLDAGYSVSHVQHYGLAVMEQLSRIETLIERSVSGQCERRFWAGLFSPSRRRDRRGNGCFALAGVFAARRFNS